RTGARSRACRCALRRRAGNGRRRRRRLLRCRVAVLPRDCDAVGARACGATRLHDGEGLSRRHARGSCVPARGVRDVSACAVHPDGRRRRRLAGRVPRGPLGACLRGQLDLRDGARARRALRRDNPTRARRRRGGRMIDLRPRDECRYDLVSLGEVMLRLDPGEGRVSTTRTFQAWEGGGEYNVARGLRRCFGLRTAIVTALVDNPVGRLIEDLMLQGGCDLSHLKWVADDGVGRRARNGLNFTERGFGVRAALGCSDRGHTAVSQLKEGYVDWKKLFEGGVRWFHTGGIFAALSETTPLVAREAMEAARKTGAIVS